MDFSYAPKSFLLKKYPALLLSIAISSTILKAGPEQIKTVSPEVKGCNYAGFSYSLLCVS